MDASNAVVTVQRLDEASTARWDNFVQSCPDATFFHRAGWKYVIESSFGRRCYFLYAQRAGGICGVLPLVHIKSMLFGNSLVSTGFTVSGGPAVSDSDAMPVLEDAAIALADELDVDFLDSTPSKNGRLSRRPDNFRRSLPSDTPAYRRRAPSDQHIVQPPPLVRLSGKSASFR